MMLKTWHLVLASLSIGFFTDYELLDRLFAIPLPKYQDSVRTVWLEQNWSQEQRNWFHHADLGSESFGIPLEWLLALEQPKLFLGQPRLMGDPSYLDRFGFIPDPSDSASGRLPIGFSHGANLSMPDGSSWMNPQSNKPMSAVGLTCAACHTGRLTYRGTEVLVDGAPALIDLGLFKDTLARSLILTRFLPSRLDRFADRILGPDNTADARLALLSQIDAVIKRDQIIEGLEHAVAHHAVTEGFARLDIFNRMGNSIFALDSQRIANYSATIAPVHYPQIWDASWFKWTGVNGSIEQPMVHYAGVALGFGALARLTSSGPEQFDSSLQVNTIYEAEQLLAGSQPSAAGGFSGLRPPMWPSGVLPPIDPTVAEKGARLYEELCQGCHLQPISTPGFWSSPRWVSANAMGQHTLDLNLIPLEDIGTDPAQSAGFRTRSVSLPDKVGVSTSQFDVALGQIVFKLVNHWYDTQQPPVSTNERTKMEGARPYALRAPRAYKARPLDGIWAAPPYLHNGSVPSLYALLSPVSERPAKFYLGRRDYDPDQVGYLTEPMLGAFEFDTSIPGNSNSGHEFTDDTHRQGVIGRLLNPEERRSLIEFLKTL